MSEKKVDAKLEEFKAQLKAMRPVELVKVALPETKYLVVAAAAAGAAKFFIDPAGSIVDAVVYGIGGAAVVTAAKLTLTSEGRETAKELLHRGTSILEKKEEGVADWAKGTAPKAE